MMVLCLAWSDRAQARVGRAVLLEWQTMHDEYLSHTSSSNVQGVAITFPT